MSDFQHLLPPSSSPTERAIETIMAERTLGIEAPISKLWNADDCPVEFLPWLAWALSVEIWDHAWPEATKRAVIGNSITVHRLKGTRQSVELALAALGFRIEIVEGWQDGGAPHTFRLDAYSDDVIAAGHVIGPKLQAEVTRLIEQVKPVRSHFSLRIGETFAARTSARTGTYQRRTHAQTLTLRTRPVERASIAGMRVATAAVRVSRILHTPMTRPAEAHSHISARALMRSLAISRQLHDPQRRGLPADVPPGDVRRVNIAALIKRVEQLGAFTWSPVVPGIGAARARYPRNIEVGEVRVGPPYSSVKTVGATVGQDISIETFLSAVANPDSILYGVDLYDIAPSGRAFYGAVCSNFLAEGFLWSYSPTTAILSRDWEKWGFRAQIVDFTFEDVEVGDVVVTDGGGHIELAVAKTGATVTMFDQTFDGPDRQTWRKPAFMNYARGRGYKLLKFDFTAVDIHYRANRFAPIRDEMARVPAANPHLLLNRGNRANYAPAEQVRFNIRVVASRLIVIRDGLPVDVIAAQRPQIVSRSYTVPGHYRSWLILADGSASRAEEFRVASVTASASVQVILQGQPVTVTFAASNSDPVNLIVERTRHNSIAKGILRELTVQERVAGRVTFTHHLPGNFNIQIRAVNDFGAVFSSPAWRMPLTVLSQ